MIDRAHLLPSSLPELTLVKGPGGYGKTIATSQWARNLQADTRVVWVFGAVVSSEHFWQELFEALSSRLKEDNALHPDALATFTRHQPGDTAEMKARRVAGAIESNFVLVIDNFEALTTPEIDLGLIEMVEQSPGLKLVVLGRRYTLLDGPLTKARLRTHVITAENLAFREQDVRELAQTCGELAQTCSRPR